MVPLDLNKYGKLWYKRLYMRLLISSNGTASVEDEIKVSTYSNPLGVGKESVISGNGNKLPEGVNPKNEEYISFDEKLF